MDTKDSPQHFLDTSVARSLLLGTQAYKQYLHSQFDERPLHISNYVLAGNETQLSDEYHFLLLCSALRYYQNYW